jgi:hypothetical protein
MTSTPSRLALAVLSSLAVAWGINALYMAAFPVSVDGPTPPFHVPSWLEPYSESARLICSITPGIALGAIARWKPRLLGFAVGAVVFCYTYVVVSDPGLGYSSWALDLAFRTALLWGLGVIAGSCFMLSRMPNTSLERTREG